jgi:DNA-nicking Smr family endonuclease
MARGKQLSDTERQLFEEAMQGVRRIEMPNLAPEIQGRRKAPAAETPQNDDTAPTRRERDSRKPGIQESVLRNLRNGRIPIEAQLDLHGLTQPEAKTALETFLSQSQAADRQRAVRVIHGKGHGSPEGKSALREVVIERLRHSGVVLAFCEAGPNDGGSGAVRILLKRRA